MKTVTRQPNPFTIRATAWHELLRLTRRPRRATKRTLTNEDEERSRIMTSQTITMHNAKTTGT